MKHTFLPLIPMKSRRKMLLRIQQSEGVGVGVGGAGGSDVERLRGHYRESLITPWLQLCSITPVKIHPHPRVKKVEESLSSQLFVAAPPPTPPALQNQTGQVGLGALRPPEILYGYGFLLWERRRCGLRDQSVRSIGSVVGIIE